MKENRILIALIQELYYLHVYSKGVENLPIQLTSDRIGYFYNRLIDEASSIPRQGKFYLREKKKQEEILKQD